MKQKYKMYVLLYTFGVTLVTAPVAMYYVVRFPEMTLLYGGVASVVYFSVLLTGNKYISRLAKKDPPSIV
jgi:hypothetical protein